MIYDCDISGDYPSSGWFELRGFAFLFSPLFLLCVSAMRCFLPVSFPPSFPPSFYLFSLTLLPYLSCRYFTVLALVLYYGFLEPWMLGWLIRLRCVA